MAGEPNYNCRIPAPQTPMVDPDTGMISPAWFRWATAMMTRTGDSVGIGTATVEASATTAQTTANTAQSTANTAQTTASAAQSTATGAQTAATAASAAIVAEANARAAADASEATARAAADTAEATARTAAITTEATARAAADALLAPKASPTFTGIINLPAFVNAVNDAAAAAAGVAVGQMYRNGSQLMVRIV